MWCLAESHTGSSSGLRYRGVFFDLDFDFCAGAGRCFRLRGDFFTVVTESVSATAAGVTVTESVTPVES